jgi:hypothetical protein
MAGNQVVIPQAVIDQLQTLSDAFVKGDPGIDQWIMLGLPSPTFATDDKGHPFLEAKLLKGKYDRSSNDLLDRIKVLQSALVGLSEIAKDIAKAGTDAMKGAANWQAELNTALDSIPKKVEDVLKLAKPPDDAGPGPNPNYTQQM